MTRRSLAFSTTVTAILLACGGRVSAVPTTDASVSNDGGADAGPTQRCGDQTCMGDEMCITHPVQPGPAIYECVPFPAGCEREQTCICVEYHLPMACKGPAQGCSDDKLPVTLFCD